MQLLIEARVNKGNLVVLWLDLENADGALPHKLVEEVLRRHHIPNIISNLIRDYYNDFHIRVFIKNDHIRMAQDRKRHHNWQYNISVLFSSAMNMLVKAAEKECQGPQSESGVEHPPIRAYMDDLTVTIKSVTGGK